MDTPDMRWNSAAVVLPLSDDRIDIWRAELKTSPATLEQYYGLLSTDERERASSFHFDKDRDRYCIRRALLRKLIAGYLETEPATIQFSYNDYGKPSIDNTSSGRIQFNLSFSNELALFAFSREQIIGIDIEKNNASILDENIAQRYFSGAETKALFALPRHQQLTAFYNCWTRKEAWIKARGMGLSIPLNSFTVSLAPDEPASLLAVADNSALASDWSLYALTPAPDYTAALAARGLCKPPRLLDWQVGVA